MPENAELQSLLIELTAEIASAYVANNNVPAPELPNLIKTIFSALTGAESPAPPVVAEPLVPAISIKKSVTDDYVICLEDGRRFKSLKRHLRAKYNLSPEEYRAKWGLPKDYPMVAPEYAKKRSNLAKAIGLGTRTRERAHLQALSIRLPAISSRSWRSPRKYTAAGASTSMAMA